MTIWVYIQSEPGMYTTGFYGPHGTWNPDRDFTGLGAVERAAERVHYLNGGRDCE